MQNVSKSLQLEPRGKIWMQHGHVILRRHTKKTKRQFSGGWNCYRPLKRKYQLKFPIFKPQMTVHLKGLYTATLPPRQTQSERDLLLSILIMHTHTYFFNFRLLLWRHTPNLQVRSVSGVWFVTGKPGEQSRTPSIREEQNKDRISHAILKPPENDSVDLVCSNLKEALWSLVKWEK